MAEDVRYTMSLQDLVSPALERAEGNANRFEGALGNISKVAGRISVALAGAFAISGITDVVKSVVDAGSKVENARTGLTTLLKDQAAASQVIKDTMTDATRTPFAFEGLLSANKALISAGESAGHARQTVLDLANAIAATGGGDEELQRMVVNLQQIRNVGEATAVDIKQFAIAGVNIYQVLADATHKPISKVKEMTVSYDMLAYALQQAHAKGGIYANGLENMAKNTSVNISNIGDALFQFKVRMFDDFKPAIDAALSGTMAFLNKVMDGYEWLKGKYLQIIPDNFLDILKSAADQIWNFFKPIVDTIMPIMSSIYNGYMKVSAAFMEFSGPAQQLLTWLRDILATALTYLPPVITFLYNVIATTVDVLHTVYVILEKLGIIRAIGDLFKLVWEVLKYIGGELQKIWEQRIKPIVDAIGWAYGKLKEFLGIKATVDVTTNQTVKSTLKTAVDDNKNKPAGTTPTLKNPGLGNQTSKVTGQKNVTINIRIDSLIKDFKIQTTNLREGAQQVKQKIAESLITATNDAQILAGE